MFMWHCLKCGEDVEDHFDLCWNCQANRRGLRHFSQIELDALADDRERARVNKKHRPMNCLRCGSALSYTGSRRLQQGSSRGIFGDLGELLVGKEVIEMYTCADCGHVEFFVFGE